MNDPNGSLTLLHRPAVLEGVLRAYPLFRGISAEDLGSVVALGRVVHRPGGDLLAKENQVIDSLFVVLRGRVEVSHVLADGGQRVLGQHGPGDHFGEMGVLAGGRLALRIVASTDVLLLELSRGSFEQLLRTIPVFAENLTRALGLRLASSNAGRAGRSLLGVVGVALTSQRSGSWIAALCEALRARGATYRLLVSREAREQLADVDDRLVDMGLVDACIDAERGSAAQVEVVQKIAELRSTSDLVLVALEPGFERYPYDPRLVPIEELWWVVDPAGYPTFRSTIDDLMARRRNLRGRTRLMWALHEGERPSRGVRSQSLLSPDLRAFLPRSGRPTSRRERNSFRRIVGHLEGMRVGIALGGGGSRGLAHCGVLRVLEREGIAADRLAGTSMGALVAMKYSAGTDPDEIVEDVTRAARSPAPLRWLPWGDLASYSLKARTGAFERILRGKYGDIRFEELDLPLRTVSADLVRGEPVVREQGDCVDAVIESITIPMFARPILRDGCALVDGGLLNNLPTDLLIAQQMELVVGVNVLSTADSFAAHRRSNGEVRRPGVIELLLRVAEIQHERLSALGAMQADLLLHVDVGKFALMDFSPTRARELAAEGQRVAEENAEKIRSLLPAKWRGRI